MFLYRTQSSTNRRTEDLMLSGKSFIKIRNRIGPKTEPWGTPDTTSTGQYLSIGNMFSFISDQTFLCQRLQWNLHQAELTQGRLDLTRGP